MKLRRATAALVLVLIASTWSELSFAAVEEITINGESYNLVRLSEDEVQQSIPKFEAEMKSRKLPGRIVQCISGIDLPVGTAHGNHSYGSYCILKNEGALTPVQICRDELVGHFKVAPVDLTTASIKNLANFIRANCYGG
ncbi:hypothetical protein AAII07_24830 [Microvirga sp. 0TCS3.31]